MPSFENLLIPTSLSSSPPPPSIPPSLNSTRWGDSGWVPPALACPPCPLPPGPWAVQGHGHEDRGGDACPEWVCDQWEGTWWLRSAFRLEPKEHTLRCTRACTHTLCEFHILSNVNMKARKMVMWRHLLAVAMKLTYNTLTTRLRGHPTVGLHAICRLWKLVLTSLIVGLLICN